LGGESLMEKDDINDMAVKIAIVLINEGVDEI
jgi:hypothetical protein